ncbi:MAG: UvrB/UvrC motif-containing protein [Pirellulales bacterium]|nr:UvrB/UvrC motif-containing protein [Pirellulales bacterium]
MASSDKPDDHIDALLSSWEFHPSDIKARVVKGGDGREVLQTRVELGVLQMEVSGRPDGEKPGGQQTYLDFLISEEFHRGESFVLTDEERLEVDREFMQFYQRRICWLTLKNYAAAMSDADHTLTLMDVVKRHSPDEDWTLAHEQYRPFVLFHRTQAAALAALENKEAEDAISAINTGLERMEEFFAEHDAAERFDDDEMVKRLRALRESMREQFKVGKTLNEQLAEAVASEEFELAARLRDEIRKQQGQL